MALDVPKWAYLLVQTVLATALFAILASPPAQRLARGLPFAARSDSRLLALLALLFAACYATFVFLWETAAADADLQE